MMVDGNKGVIERNLNYCSSSFFFLWRLYRYKYKYEHEIKPLATRQPTPIH